MVNNKVNIVNMFSEEVKNEAKRILELIQELKKQSGLQEYKIGEVLGFEHKSQMSYFKGKLLPAIIESSFTYEDELIEISEEVIKKWGNNLPVRIFEEFFILIERLEDKIKEFDVKLKKDDNELEGYELWKNFRYDAFSKNIHNAINDLKGIEGFYYLYRHVITPPKYANDAYSKNIHRFPILIAKNEKEGLMEFKMKTFDFIHTYSTKQTPTTYSGIIFKSENELFLEAVNKEYDRYVRVSCLFKIGERFNRRKALSKVSGVENNEDIIDDQLVDFPIKPNGLFRFSRFSNNSGENHEIIKYPCSIEKIRREVRLNFFTESPILQIKKEKISKYDEDICSWLFEKNKYNFQRILLSHM